MSTSPSSSIFTLAVMIKVLSFYFSYFHAESHIALELPPCDMKKETELLENTPRLLIFICSAVFLYLALMSLGYCKPVRFCLSGLFFRLRGQYKYWTTCKSRNQSILWFHTRFLPPVHSVRERYKKRARLQRFEERRNLCTLTWINWNF